MRGWYSLDHQEGCQGPYYEGYDAEYVILAGIVAVTNTEG